MEKEMETIWGLYWGYVKQSIWFDALLSFGVGGPVFI